MLQSHQLVAARLGQPIPPPKRRNNLESEMQRALIKWWAVECKKFGVPECLLFSIPNGGNWDAKRGSIMKLEGQRKGAPDLCLAISRRRCPESDGPYMLFIELKTPNGVVSNEQGLFRIHLRDQGYQHEVCHSLEEAQKVITEYLT